MKKISKILPFIIMIVIFAGIMYTLGLPPFNPIEPEPPKIVEKLKKEKTVEQTNLQIPKISDKSAYEAYNEAMKQGAELAKKGYYSLAINEYRKASSSLPGSTEPLNEIGKIYLTQKNSEKAANAFQEIILMGAKDEMVKINLGRAYLQSGDTQRAEEILTTIAAPNQITDYYKGIISARSGDYEKSKNLLNSALNGQNEWIKTRAQIFLQAFFEFAKFEGGQPVHLKTLIAKAFNQTGEFSLAAQILTDVIKEKKDYRDAWILLGYAYMNNSKTKEAIEALEEGRKLDPSKPETLFFLGLAYFADNKIDNAINYIESALEKGFEPRIQAHQKLAELYFIKQDYEKSVKAYEAVLGINSENIDYFIRPIWIYIEKLNNPAAALSIAQTSLAKHPGNAMAHNLIGWAYIANGDYKMAKKNLETAMKINPGLSAVYLNMGQMYEKMGYMLTAKEYYKQAFTLDKNITSVGATAAERYNKIAQAEQKQAQAQTETHTPGKIYQINTFNP